MNAVLEASTQTATEVILANRGVVLVDFTATWCAPCRALAPVLDQLAGETDDLTVLKVDVDAHPEFAAGYGVMSFPTLMFFVDGQPVHRLVGSRGLGSLRQELEQVRDRAHAES